MSLKDGRYFHIEIFLESYFCGRGAGNRTLPLSPSARAQGGARARPRRTSGCPRAAPVRFSLIFVYKLNISCIAFFVSLVGVPGIEPGLNPPHGLVLPVYYTPHFYYIYDILKE